MVVNNGEMQDGPSSGPRCWERKHLVFWAEWAGRQVPLGWEGKGGVFPKQTLWLFIPTEASIGLGGAQAQCFLGVRVVGIPAPHQHRDPVGGSAPIALFLALLPTGVPELWASPGSASCSVSLQL